MLASRSFSVLVLLALPRLLVACAEQRDSAGEDDSPGGRPAFCERPGNDAIHELFCGIERPEITGIAGLNAALALTEANMLGHSTSLSGRLVSAINPRIIFLRGQVDQGNILALAFTRGAQRVELIAQDYDTRALRLYLLDFAQACNRAEHGCRPGDLFTPAIEDDWREVRVRDDEELKNTPEDCRRCHGGGEGEQGPSMLLLREFLPPWMHWLKTNGVFQVGVIGADYVAAKRLPSDSSSDALTEPYAGLTVPELLDGVNILQGYVFQAARQLGHPAQPLLFPSTEIGLETTQYAGPYGFYPGPGLDSDELVSSSTWQTLYDAFLAGEGPAPPYHHERITDRAKLNAATQAYQSFLSGALDADDLPDISDVLPDDQHRLAEMGFAVEPDADGPELLIQACKPCHDASLDQTVSRARFAAAIGPMPRNELELAIQRLKLPEDNPLRMPPRDARELDPDARARLIEHLESLR
jgi:hypothetical protein